MLVNKWIVVLFMLLCMLFWFVCVKEYKLILKDYLFYFVEIKVFVNKKLCLFIEN